MDELKAARISVDVVVGKLIEGLNGINSDFREQSFKHCFEHRIGILEVKFARFQQILDYLLIHRQPQLRCGHSGGEKLQRQEGDRKAEYKASRETASAS
jgi:hypothetical protein